MLKLTSIKILEPLYNEFKMICIGRKMSLQKMLNRKSEDEIIESEAVNTEKDKPGNK